MTDTVSTSQAPLSAGAREWLLAFADDEHMIGARHAAWIGLGPFLEEDLAFCSIAQDELGHAISLYEFLTDDVDRYALLRDAGDYRSAWLCELPCNQWDQALTRHWLYDCAEQLRWDSLAESSHSDLRAIAARAQKEEAFHRQHSDLFLTRIANGDPEGRRRIQEAVTLLLPYAIALWEPVAGETEAVADGFISADSETLGHQWAGAVQADLERWNLEVNWPDPVQGQDSRRCRSDEFPALHTSLQEVIALDPAATW